MPFMKIKSCIITATAQLVHICVNDQNLNIGTICKSRTYVNILSQVIHLVLVNHLREDQVAPEAGLLHQEHLRHPSRWRGPQYHQFLP